MRHRTDILSHGGGEGIHADIHQLGGVVVGLQVLGGDAVLDRHGADLVGKGRRSHDALTVGLIDLGEQLGDPSRRQRVPHRQGGRGPLLAKGLGFLGGLLLFPPQVCQLGSEPIGFLGQGRGIHPRLGEPHAHLVDRVALLADGGGGVVHLQLELKLLIGQVLAEATRGLDLLGQGGHVPFVLGQLGLQRVDGLLMLLVGGDVRLGLLQGTNLSLRLREDLLGGAERTAEITAQLCAELDEHGIFLLPCGHMVKLLYFLFCSSTSSLLSRIHRVRPA